MTIGGAGMLVTSTFSSPRWFDGDVLSSCCAENETLTGGGLKTSGRLSTTERGENQFDVT